MRAPLRIVFLGSKPVGYRCLRYLLEQRGTLGCEVVAVRTQARKEFGGDEEVSVLAIEAGIPLLASLDELPECDIIYSVQHHELLKAVHIGKAGRIAVNLHMAPLPEYRGCNQFSYAIIDSKEEFGTTIHEIDTRIDHGAILFQKRFAVPEDCWVDEIYQLTLDASVALFKESIQAIVNGDYIRTPQQELEAVHGTALHYRRDVQVLKEIDLGWPADKIARHVRATSMPGFEPPYCRIGGEKIYFATKPS